MDEAGGEDDAGSEGLDDEEDVLLGAERRDPPTEHRDEHADAAADEDGEYGADPEPEGDRLVAAFLVLRAGAVAVGGGEEWEEDEEDEEQAESPAVAGHRRLSSNRRKEKLYLEWKAELSSWTQSFLL